MLGREMIGDTRFLANESGVIAACAKRKEIFSALEYNEKTDYNLFKRSQAVMLSPAWLHFYNSLRIPEKFIFVRQRKLSPVSISQDSK